MSSAEIKELQTSPLWYKINVFVYDLRHFREKVLSRERLETICDASYIGLPYFTADEVIKLKATLINGKPLSDVIEQELNERLERRQKKRAESGDYRVCAAHDLAPIFEKAFSIKPRDLNRDRGFLDLVDMSGLELKEGQSWEAKPMDQRQQRGARRGRGNNNWRR